jgi:hypothetical protein
MMKNQRGTTNEVQYLDTKYVREHLMVSRTKAYEIRKEIEETCAPSAVVRIGRCLRVRKDVFVRWVDEQGTRGDYTERSERQTCGQPASLFSPGLRANAHCPGGCEGLSDLVRRKSLQIPDIEEAITHAVTQPEIVSANEILIRPTQQPV